MDTNFDVVRTDLVVTDMRVEGDKVIGTMTLLKTERSAEALKKIMDGGMVHIASRAIGSLKTTPEGQVVEPDNFQLLGFDLVLDNGARTEEIKVSGGKGQAIAHLETVFIPDLGKPNNNGRIYSREVWDRVLSDPQMQQRLKERRMLGTVYLGLDEDSK